MAVEIFKTSVQKYIEGQLIISLLERKFPKAKVSFDLEDCDNILRIEAEKIDCIAIQKLLQARGLICELIK